MLSLLLGMFAKEEPKRTEPKIFKTAHYTEFNNVIMWDQYPITLLTNLKDDEMREGDIIDCYQSKKQFKVVYSRPICDVPGLFAISVEEICKCKKNQ